MLCIPVNMFRADRGPELWSIGSAERVEHLTFWAKREAGIPEWSTIKRLRHCMERGVCGGVFIAQVHGVHLRFLMVSWPCMLWS